MQAEPTRHDSISNQAKFLKRSSETLRDAAERHKTDVIGEDIKISFIFVYFKLVNLNYLWYLIWLKHVKIRWTHISNDEFLAQHNCLNLQ